MKAALLVEPGRIVIDEIAAPEVGPGDVAIAVGGVGLCGSDLSVFSGKWTTPSSPWVMGHEAFGVIESVGHGVPGERIGQTVVVEPNAVCSTCQQCRRGWTSACTARQSVGMNRPGALAERLVVPSGFAWPISSMDPTDLVCVEPTTVVLAALRRLGAPLPASVLVVGVGAQGLLMSLALLDRGLEVHAYDVNPDRVAFASSLGAHATVADDVEPRFGLVVDTVGSPSSMQVAMGRLEVGGTLLFLGLDSQPLLCRPRRSFGSSSSCGAHLRTTIPGFRRHDRLLNQGRFRPGRVISDVYDMVDPRRRSIVPPGHRGRPGFASLTGLKSLTTSVASRIIGRCPTMRTLPRPRPLQAALGGNARGLIGPFLSLEQLRERP